MFNIRKVHDTVFPADRLAVEQSQAILTAAFPDARAEDVGALPAKLHDPMKYRFRTLLFVAERGPGEVIALALVQHEASIGFVFLDFISTRPGDEGGGLGGALYERVREEARALGAVGIFFECLPDDPALSPEADRRRQNEARLAFYERYGARPIAGTAYESPLSPEDTEPPYLCFDDVGSGRPLRRAKAREVVRAILERKYAHLCPPAYVEGVLRSFSQDPVPLRAPRYGGAGELTTPSGLPLDRRGVLATNRDHPIHHVRERGYVEVPARVSRIREALIGPGLFREIPVRAYPDSKITAVHDAAFVRYLKRVCEQVGNEKSVYPYVFPVRNATRPPTDLVRCAGYYCIDTFTPLNLNAWRAARAAVDAALTAADALLDGQRVTYALVRPPGHHAERGYFGGFCYLNNNAIAAEHLSAHGRVAILDLDYHHGNGQQAIFYDRSDVLTVSIHGHPRFAYPYFTGFADERGEGEGKGKNLNIPLAESVDGATYHAALDKALAAIRRFEPACVVVALGLDTARHDPTGTWSLGPADFRENGARIAALGRSVLVVQEGGYRTRTLGRNARAFFEGLLRVKVRGRTVAAQAT